MGIPIAKIAEGTPSLKPAHLCYNTTREETAMTTANRKYKDSVFVDLFSEDEKAKENFLSLYNALHNTNLQLSCPVENIRLDNIMYMNIINDVSCLVDNKIIVLAEHQSTINENMPNATTVPPCTVVAYEFFF